MIGLISGSEGFARKSEKSVAGANADESGQRDHGDERTLQHRLDRAERRGQVGEKGSREDSEDENETHHVSDQCPAKREHESYVEPEQGQGEGGHQSVGGRVFESRVRRVPLARGDRARCDGLRQLPQVSSQLAEAGRPRCDQAGGDTIGGQAKAGAESAAKALGRGDQRWQLPVHTTEHGRGVDPFRGEREREQESEEAENGDKGGGSRKREIGLVAGISNGRCIATCPQESGVLVGGTEHELPSNDRATIGVAEPDLADTDDEIGEAAGETAAGRQGEGTGEEEQQEEEGVETGR